MKKLVVALLVLLAAALPAYAQNTVTLTPSVTTGNGVLTTNMTWSTAPAMPGTPCTASAVPATTQWTGAKPSSGSQNGLTFTDDQELRLACSFLGDSIVTFTWTPPTQNTNGMPLTDLAGYRIKYTFGPTLTADPLVAAAGETHVDVAAPASTRTVTGISQTGTLRGHMYSRNTGNLYSVPSNVATKVFTGNVVVTQQVDLIVRWIPNAPSGVTTQ